MDALSRTAAIHNVSLEVDYTRMAADQLEDSQFLTCREADKSLQWESIPLSPNGPGLLCDVVTGAPRPWVPQQWRRRVFDLVHGVAHPGANATVKMVRKRLIWHGLAKEVRQWARTCTECQQSKVHRHVKSDFKQFHLPSARFSHVHVDLVGPLPPSEGFRYLLTIVDRHTRWPEAVPLQEISAVTCARAFLHVWISRFGVPSHITSDRGGQFISGLWTRLAEALGVEVHRTTSFHAQANGMVERFHRQLKAALTARLSTGAWVQELPWVLLGLRAMPKDDLGCSTAELVYGSTLRLPGEFVRDSASEVPSERLNQLRETLANLMPTPPRWQRATEQKDPAMIPGLLRGAKYVFVRVDAVKPDLSRQYEGPFRVLEAGPKTFKLLWNGKEDHVSVDRLKQAFVDQEIEVASWSTPQALSAPPPPSEPPAAPPSAVRTPELLVSSPEAPTSSPTHTTRSGRAVRMPPHLRNFDCSRQGFDVSGVTLEGGYCSGC